MSEALNRGLSIQTVGVLYLVAPKLLLIGTFGLFDQELDHFSGFIFIPPWPLWLDLVPVT